MHWIPLYNLPVLAVTPYCQKLLKQLTDMFLDHCVLYNNEKSSLIPSWVICSLLIIVEFKRKCFKSFFKFFGIFLEPLRCIHINEPKKDDSWFLIFELPSLVKFDIWALASEFLLRFSDFAIRSLFTTCSCVPQVLC